MRAPTRLVFVGWGAINSRVGELLTQRRTAVAIAGIAVRTAEARLPAGIPRVTSADELIALKPDLVIEAAGRAAGSKWAPAALAAAPALIMTSTSALPWSE